MNTISLTVTAKSAAYLAGQPGAAGRQLAIKDASPNIRAALDKATKDNVVKILLGQRLTLVVGDTHAIWRSHNMICTADYDALFDLIALRPDATMVFLCDVIS